MRDFAAGEALIIDVQLAATVTQTAYPAPLTLPTPPLDVLNQGMRVQIVDLGAGSTVLLDHFIPGGAVPNDSATRAGLSG